jgi:Tfp pilus assembly protein PilN
MIRINLLPRKRSRSSADPAQQVMLAGFFTFILVGGGLYFGLHAPISSKIDDYKQKNGQITAENQAIEARTKDFNAIKQAVSLAEVQKQSIEELNEARAVPAWLLYELGQILSAEGRPTMTDAMAKRVRDDPNRSWAEGWDPKQAWVTSFNENQGRFRLEGAASSGSDMTQLALRLQASTFFDQVVPEGGSAGSRAGGVSIYRFTISGRVRY